MSAKHGMIDSGGLKIRFKSSVGFVSGEILRKIYSRDLEVLINVGLSTNVRSRCEES